MFSANIALAIPGIPNAFYGYVTWNGNAAPDGTTVIAKINGAQVATTTTLGGKYGYPTGSFYVADPNNDRTGSTINFFVNNVDTGKTAVFATGGITQINLSASGGSTSNPPPSSGGGGTFGGSTGGTTTGTTNQTNQTGTTGGTTPQACQEKWICSEWSACKDGIQTRTCSDENKCGTNNKEPFISQPCSSEERKEEAKAETPIITGFFLGLSTTDWLTGIVIGIIAAAIIIFILKRKPTRRK